MEKWTFENRHFDQLSELIHIVSPSMKEGEMASYLRDKWKDAGGEVKTDILGNTYASFSKGKGINIGLVAHMDSVAIQITKILQNGFLKFRSIGLRTHLLLGQNMKVQTDGGLLHGIIGFDPMSQHGKNQGIGEEDLWLDIGVNSYEETASILEVGDMAILSPQLNRMDEHLISGTAIDNRIGLFILNECVELFNKYAFDICLHVIGSVQEEVGLRGANVIATQCELDACFIIDVDYASDTLVSYDNQMGSLCLGEGVGLHVKADNNPTLRKILCDVAKRNEISYQKSLGRFIYGGTDATALQIQSGGVATVNINIPCRYMHSPVEMINVQDVEHAINLIMYTLEEISTKQKSDFIPF